MSQTICTFTGFVTLTPHPLLGRWQRKCKTLNRYSLPNTTQVGSTKMIIHVSQKILYNEMKQEIMTNEISMLKRK